MSDLECNELTNDLTGTASDPCVGVGGLYCNSEDWGSWDRVIELLRAQLFAANALLKAQSFEAGSPAKAQADRVQADLIIWLGRTQFREKPPSDAKAFAKGLVGMIVYNRQTRKARDQAVEGCKILGRVSAVLSAAGAGEQSDKLDAQLHEWFELGKLAPKGLSWKAWTVIGIGGGSLVTFALWRLGLLSPRRRR